MCASSIYSYEAPAAYFMAELVRKGKEKIAKISFLPSIIARIFPSGENNSKGKRHHLRGISIYDIYLGYALVNM